MPDRDLPARPNLEQYKKQAKDLVKNFGHGNPHLRESDIQSAFARTDAQPHAVNSTPKSRIGSIDLIRGAVMTLMAIDHVRVYSGVPPGGPTAGVFFTRWITHFCAPAFIFLAGTSVFFNGRKHADLSRYLLIRGAWLIFLELTFLRAAWTFNCDFRHYEMAGVIWVIGCCMILMAGLVKLPLSAVGIKNPPVPHKPKHNWGWEGGAARTRDQWYVTGKRDDAKSEGGGLEGLADR